jgi:anti-sigma regulatory factor (Ser/Thr protein kinase)
MIIAVADSSQVAAARRAATELAGRHGFDKDHAGRVALVATEIATNLLKHATRGELNIEHYDDASGSGIELLGLDKGNGIADMAKALRDGFSTAGSPGNGMGVMQNQTDQFEVFSRAGSGTAVVARIAAAASPPPQATPLIGAVVVPYPGETVCGDAWAFGAPNGKPTLLMVDGSGHGSQAEAAAKVAVQSFNDQLRENITVLVEEMHRALAPTRGAAVAVAQYDRAQGIVRYVGVGNISGAAVSGAEVRRMVTHNGTAGHVAPRIREFDYPFAGGGTILLHTDGLSARWDLGQYPGLSMSHPSLLAGILYRDHRRGRDDASIVAMRV